eukprot:387793-Pyramimonas_sp.AAC.1
MPPSPDLSKDEAKANKDAQAALTLRKDWDRLRDIGTWIEDGVREYSDVVAELKGKTAHFGRLFAILVEQNSELPLGHKDGNYKGRVVFDGSSVRDQNKDVALFQELSSSPATMQASKAAGTYGLFEGHRIEQADA